MYVLSICMSQFKWENIDLLTPHGRFKMDCPYFGHGPHFVTF